MVISTCNAAKTAEFESLMEQTVGGLHKDCETKPRYYASRTAEKFEDDVCEVMKSSARRTIFDGTIKKTSGQAFPDIIACGFFGVEVKTTVKNHYRTTGNSVLESTRISGIERIYLLFGKLAKPIDFRWKKYEECLSDVVVTHSPRYLIDMDTSPDKTIFTEMGINYDELRKRDNPIKPIIDYYRRGLKKGEDLWWLDTGEPSEPSGSLIVRLWSNISKEEREDLVCQGMGLFPEIFGNSSKKYQRFAVWLVGRHSVLLPNTRDPFSAKGQITINVAGVNYSKIPRIFENLRMRIKKVQEYVLSLPKSDIEYYWGEGVAHSERIKRWVELVEGHSKRMLHDGSQFNVAKMIISELEKLRIR